MSEQLLDALNETARLAAEIAWLEGVNTQWTHRNGIVPIEQNPYRKVDSQ